MIEYRNPNSKIEGLELKIPSTSTLINTNQYDENKQILEKKSRKR